MRQEVRQEVDCGREPSVRVANFASVFFRQITAKAGIKGQRPQTALPYHNYENIQPGEDRFLDPMKQDQWFKKRLEAKKARADACSKTASEASAKLTVTREQFSGDTVSGDEAGEDEQTEMDDGEKSF